MRDTACLLCALKVSVYEKEVKDAIIISVLQNHGRVVTPLSWLFFGEDLFNRSKVLVFEIVRCARDQLAYLFGVRIAETVKRIACLILAG